MDELRYIFARWGIPQQIVTDNGPQFVSKMFQRFTSSNNIKHIKSSPYHPATNGLAERFVQTLKQALRVSRKDNRSLQHRLASFLMNYRNARHSTTETAPACLMMGRELRCRLHLLKPDLRGTVSKAMTRQVMTRPAAVERNFEEGETVMVRDYRPGHIQWQPATVTKKMGVKSYQVDLGNGGVWKRHADQIRPDDERRVTEESTEMCYPPPLSTYTEPVAQDIPDKALQPLGDMLPPLPKEPEAQRINGQKEVSQEEPETPQPPLREETSLPSARTQLQIPHTITRSGRAVRRPARYTDGGT